MILTLSRIQATKTDKPHINLQSIKASAAKATQITTSFSGIRKPDRKITEIIIPSIVLPMGRNPSELVTTSKDRSNGAVMFFFVVSNFLNLIAVFFPGLKTEVEHLLKIDKGSYVSNSFVP